ncbi:MAG: hypothetical protein ACR2O1_09085 [Boseongicola sp.]
MTPITEDQVICLMKGLEEREKKTLKRLEKAARNQNGGGQMTARILNYTSAETEDRNPRKNKCVPVALDEARAARKERRAVQGYFFYSQGGELTSA